MDSRNVWICLLTLLPLIDGQCTFPDSFNGTWITSYDGTWVTNSTHLLNYRAVSPSGVFLNSPNPTIDFTCFIQDGTKYVLRSASQVELFTNLFIFMHTCIDLREITPTKYVFYYGTVAEGTGLRFTASNTVADVCTQTDHDLAYHQHVALLNGSETSGLTLCPPSIYGSYFYNTCTDTNSNTTSVDVCDSRQQLMFNYTLCNTLQMFTDEGVLDCLFHDNVGTVSYVTLYNRDSTTPDESTTYLFVCLAIELTGTTVFITANPETCTENQSTTNISSPGQILELTPYYLCPFTDEETPFDFLPIIIGIVGFLLLLLLIIIIYYCCKRCKRKKGKKRKKKKKKKKKKKRKTDEEAPSEDEGSSSSSSTDSESTRSSSTSNSSARYEPQYFRQLDENKSVDSGISEPVVTQKTDIKDDDDADEGQTEKVLQSRMSDLPPSTFTDDDHPGTSRSDPDQDNTQEDVEKCVGEGTGVENKTTPEEDDYAEKQADKPESPEQQSRETPNLDDKVSHLDKDATDPETNDSNVDDVRDDARSISDDDADDDGDTNDVADNNGDADVDGDDAYSIDDAADYEDDKNDGADNNGDEDDVDERGDGESVHVQSEEQLVTHTDENKLEKLDDSLAENKSDKKIEDKEFAKEDDVNETQMLDRPEEDNHKEGVSNIENEDKEEENEDDYEDKSTMEAESEEDSNTDVDDKVADDDQVETAEPGNEDETKTNMDTSETMSLKEERQNENVSDTDIVQRDNIDNKTADGNGQEGHNTQSDPTEDNTEHGKETEKENIFKDQSLGKGLEREHQNTEEAHEYNVINQPVIVLDSKQQEEPDNQSEDEEVTEDESEPENENSEDAIIEEKQNEHEVVQRGVSESGETETNGNERYDEGPVSDYGKDEEKVHEQEILPEGGNIHSDTDAKEEYDGEPVSDLVTEEKAHEQENIPENENTHGETVIENDEKEEYNEALVGGDGMNQGTDKGLPAPLQNEGDNEVEGEEEKDGQVKDTNDQEEEQTANDDENEQDQNTQDEKMESDAEKDSMERHKGHGKHQRHANSDEEVTKEYNRIGGKKERSPQQVKSMITVLVSREEEDRKRNKNRDRSKNQKMRKLAKRKTIKHNTRGGNDGETINEDDYMYSSEDDTKAAGAGRSAPFIAQYNNKKRIEHILEQQHYWSDPDDEESFGINDSITSIPGNSEGDSGGDYEELIGPDGIVHRVKRTQNTDTSPEHLENELPGNKRPKSVESMASVEDPESPGGHVSKKRLNMDKIGKTEDVERKGVQNEIRKQADDVSDRASGKSTPKLILVKEKSSDKKSKRGFDADDDQLEKGKKKANDMNDKDSDASDIQSDFCDTDMDRLSERDSGLDDDVEEAIDVVLNKDQQAMIVAMLFDDEMNLRPQFSRDEAGRIIRRLDNTVIYDPHTGRLTFHKRLGKIFNVPRLKRNTKGRPTGGYVDDPFGPHESEMRMRTPSGGLVRRTASGKSIRTTITSETGSPSPELKRSRGEGKFVGFVMPHDDDMESVTVDQLDINIRGRRDIGSAIRRKLNKRLFRKKRKNPATSILPDIMTKKAWGNEGMTNGSEHSARLGSRGLTSLGTPMSRSGPSYGTPGTQRRQYANMNPEQQHMYKQGLERDRRILEERQDMLNKKPFEAFVHPESNGEKTVDFEEDFENGDHDPNRPSYHTSQSFYNDDGRLVIRERGCPELHRPATLFTIVRRQEDLEAETSERNNENTNPDRISKSAPATSSTSLLFQSEDGPPGYHKENTFQIGTRREGGNSQMSGIDNNRLRRLLEELYKDKKYFDEYIKSKEPESEEFILSKGLAEHGRGYLLERAEYWDKRGPMPPKPPMTEIGWKMHRQQTLIESRLNSDRSSAAILNLSRDEERQNVAPPGVVDEQQDDGHIESGVNESQA